MTRLIRLPEVINLTQKSRSRLYDDIAAGRFPKPIKVGERAIAFVEAEIEQWIAERMAEREAA